MTPPAAWRGPGPPARAKFRLGVSASLSVSPFFIISFPSHWQAILVVVYALIFIGLFSFWTYHQYTYIFFSQALFRKLRTAGRFFT